MQIGEHQENSDPVRIIFVETKPPVADQLILSDGNAFKFYADKYKEYYAKNM